MKIRWVKSRIRYSILAILALVVLSCSSGPTTDIYVWNYYMDYDELDEQTIFTSRVYSTTQTNWNFPYNDCRYFFEIKTFIPDKIKTFDEYEDQWNKHLINIKSIECPSGSFGQNYLKYKIDDNRPENYIGYEAEKDKDGLRKYAFSPDSGVNRFVDELYNNPNKLLTEISPLGKGNTNLIFNISGFNLSGVIKKNHFKEEENN